MRSSEPSTGPPGHLTLGSAGHIDHGKTALVEAMTGTNTDRLAEEHRRGISLELGFAELQLPDGRRLSVVDVPGHERLVRAMVSGATGIDLFLMVIAADDGVMPQTREHLTVLRALGLEHGVVALSKCDLADPDAAQIATEEARDLLPDAPLVRVSAITGEGIDDLRRRIAEVADHVDAASSAAARSRPREPAVLHVDRVFTLHGIGTVVTGTLRSGEIAAGDHMEILPRGIHARVRRAHVHGREVERAPAGQRVALNLVGVDRAQVSRGDVVASPDAGLAETYRLDVELRLEATVGSLGGERVQVHHGTRNSPARVVELGEGGLAQLRLEKPLFPRAGDRFVIRRIAPSETVGGGEILDPRPRRHGPGARTARLELIRSGSPDELILAALAEAPDGLADDPGSWRSHPLLAPALQRFSTPCWAEAIERVLSSGHASRLRARLVEAGAAPGAGGEAMARVEAPQLGQRHRRALALLAADGTEPRAPQHLAEALGIDRDQVLSLLEELQAAGHVVRVKPGVYYPREELRRLRAVIVDIARRRGSISLPEVRDELRTSRKYSQALLEYLDAADVTIRRGERHALRRNDGDRNRVGAAR